MECSADSSAFACPVATGHKHKNNMLIKSNYIKILNKMMNSNNNKVFCSTKLKICWNYSSST